MTVEELYQQIITEFYKLPGIDGLLSEPVTVTADTEAEQTLRPENDPPSTVARPEYCVCAEIKGVKGEAYTETPESFSGTLKEALEIAPSKNGISAVTVSAINAAMNHLSLSPGTFGKDRESHFEYADALYSYVTEHYGRDNIVLVGYDGYIVKKFMDEGMIFWTLDRDPANIAQDRFDHVVVNGARLNRESSYVWGKLLIVTGSTLCNGTITHYLDSGKELLFYGITCAGVATLLGLPWFLPDTGA